MTDCSTRSLAGVREDVAARQQRVPLERGARGRRGGSPRRGTRTRLLRAPGVGVIAEVKRASPSRGRLADIPDPADLAREYAAGGAR